VLFVCHESSPLPVAAELMARDAARGTDTEALGAGLVAVGVEERVERVLRERGLPVRGAASRGLSELDVEGFDVVVTLCDRSRDTCVAALAEGRTEEDGRASRSPVLSGMPAFVHWTFPDAPAVDPPGPRWTGERLHRAMDLLAARIEDLVHGGFLPALLEQHERWSRLVDGLEDGVIAHDTARRIFLFNRAAERITGARRDQVLGRDCHVVFAPDGLCGSQCAFCADPPPEDGIPDRLDYEVDLTDRGGEDRRIKMSVAPLELQPGRQWGVIATLRDRTEVTRLRRRLEDRTSFHGMVSVSPSMREIFETIGQIATSDYPVLVTGESGTGKELVAHAIHAESRRKAGPFVPINCGALPDEILESELFGHVRGAFTGAVRDKKGRFELADRGTLFLDEVGELSPSFQVKLLRVLQTGSFEMVGGEGSIKVDVRVVSATNRDPKEMVARGAFREDLYYRLRVVPLHVPPLRERTEDIPHIVDHALQGIRAESGSRALRVSDEAMRSLLAFPWPGNVRQLINALQFASLRCDAERIELAHLPVEVRSRDAQRAAPARSVSVVPARPGRRPKLDEASVRRALEQARGNKSRAARLLGVGRATLYRFLARRR
jgi:PAS domain S-box-containing protein